MLQDYSVSKCTRQCAVGGRPLEPGESFVSALVSKGGEIARVDVAASEWKGPQPETIGWWRSKMPEKASKKLRPAPNGVLLDTLSDLLERPGKEALAYLLALLLIRRRVLAEEEQLDINLNDEPQTHWSLTCPADGRQWVVPICVPRTDAMQALQDELNSLLFTEE